MTLSDVDVFDFDFDFDLSAPDNGLPRPSRKRREGAAAVVCAAVPLVVGADDGFVIVGYVG